jgi:hypothetical protein
MTLTEQDFRHDAFISYRRSDAAPFAKWLRSPKDAIGLVSFWTLSWSVRLMISGLKISNRS